jgi:hypothetical protein
MSWYKISRNKDIRKVTGVKLGDFAVVYNTNFV